MHDYVTILVANEYLVTLIALGLPLLGLYGNVCVFLNCYSFGSDWVAVVRGHPIDAAFLSIHGPLEMAAFALAAAAVQDLALSIVGLILWDQRVEWKRPLWFYGCAALSVVLIDVLEVFGKWLRYVMEST